MSSEEEEKVQFKFQRSRNHNLQIGQTDHRNGNDHRGTNPLNRNCPHWGGYPKTPPIPSSNPLNLDEREDFASNVDGEISLFSQQRAEQTRQLNRGWRKEEEGGWGSSVHVK